jgi:hypothetical protein
MQKLSYAMLSRYDGVRIFIPYATRAQPRESSTQRAPQMSLREGLRPVSP